MAFPKDYRYTREHEWIKVDGNQATIGITDYAQNSLGDIVFVELPKVGDEVTSGKTFGSVESVKAVSDLISPLSGRVVEVNQKVVDAPETVNEDPYGEGWLIRIELTDSAEVDELLDAEAYRKLIAEQ